MKIWKLKPEGDKFDYLISEEEWSYEKMKSFDGRSQKNDWTLEKVVRMEPKKHLPLGDAPGFWIPKIPVFSKKAVNCLDHIIGDNVELLPLEFDEGEFYAVNIITVLENAVNYEMSEITYFSDSSKIMHIDEYVFNKDVVKDKPIFKLKEESGCQFVSDVFVDLVRENNLMGFRFELVWDSEIVKNHQENAYENRLNEKFVSLTSEQQEIIKTYREDPRGFLKVIKRVKNPNISEGAIFAMKLSETRYCFGKVICRNTEFPEMETENSTVCFFDKISDSIEDMPEVLSMKNLLWGPVILSPAYWTLGICYTVKSCILTDREKDLEIGFYRVIEGTKEYYDVSGRKKENEPEVMELCQEWLLEDLEENLMLELLRKNSMSCKSMWEIVGVPGERG